MRITITQAPPHPTQPSWAIPSPQAHPVCRTTCRLFAASPHLAPLPLQAPLPLLLPLPPHLRGGLLPWVRLPTATHERMRKRGGRAAQLRAIPGPSNQVLERERCAFLRSGPPGPWALRRPRSSPLAPGTRAPAPTRSQEPRGRNTSGTRLKHMTASIRPGCWAAVSAGRGVPCAGKHTLCAMVEEFTLVIHKKES
jgi:hypothetical protein